MVRDIPFKEPENKGEVLICTDIQDMSFCYGNMYSVHVELNETTAITTIKKKIEVKQKRIWGQPYQPLKPSTYREDVSEIRENLLDSGRPYPGDKYFYSFSTIKKRLERKNLQMLSIYMTSSVFENPDIDIYEMVKEIFTGEEELYVPYLKCVTPEIDHPAMRYLLEKIHFTSVQLGSNGFFHSQLRLTDKIMSCSTLILETMLDDPTRLSKFRGDALIVSDVANRCKLTSNFITSRLERWFNDSVPIKEYVYLKPVPITVKSWKILEERAGTKLEKDSFPKMLEFTRGDGKKCRIELDIRRKIMIMYFEPFTEEVTDLINCNWVF